ncbi:hypothetical protein MSBR3_2474 [Methanosarcina barkeri 3]|uniref:DUF1622 domain-containing protein n=1 Tax=Methanosarcina barkeri 3 TaxID=1434107 RepID=A0A0E3SN88_METBA|nr:hypothetical protein MSBR3_2474 [Methanosarcina barkeri 3]
MVRMVLELTSVILEIFVRFFELVSALLVVYAGLKAATKILLLEAFKRPYRYEQIRREFTNKILFTLELLIVGDIIVTVRNPTADDLLLVGAIVVIRTVLGYFLSKEVKEYHFD